MRRDSCDASVLGSWSTTRGTHVARGRQQTSSSKAGEDTPISAASRGAGATLQIRCFGRFEVSRDGVPVQHWRRDRARALLKYLVVQRRPVPRETLLELLWSGVDLDVAATYLRVVLHALRQAVGTWSDGQRRDYVRLESDQLFLDPSAPLWLDTDVFMAHVQAAETAARENRHVEAFHEHVDAEALYRDDYLVEDTLEQSTLLRREELKDRYQVVLMRLADFCIETGDFVGCIARCHKLLVQDNCREDVYQRLMYCHTALGQRSRALRWYEICQTALVNAFGVGPGEPTRSMYERIASDASLGPSMDWLHFDRPPLLDGRRA
jgi:DNA-binding SARP family transcriptional activator